MLNEDQLYGSILECRTNNASVIRFESHTDQLFTA